MWRKITANDRNMLTVLADIKDFLLLDKLATTNAGDFLIVGASAQSLSVVETITVTVASLSPTTFDVAGSITGSIATGIATDTPFQSDYISFTLLDIAGLSVSDSTTISITTVASVWTAELWDGVNGILDLKSVGESGTDAIYISLGMYENADTGVRNYDGLTIQSSLTAVSGESDTFSMPFSQIDNDLYIFKTKKSVQMSYESNFVYDTLLGAGVFDRFDLPVNAPNPLYTYGNYTLSSIPNSIIPIFFDQRLSSSSSTYTSSADCFFNEVWCPHNIQGKTGFGDVYTAPRHYLRKHSITTGEALIIPMIIARTGSLTNGTDGVMSSLAGDYLVLGSIENTFHAVGGIVDGVINIVKDRVFKGFRTAQNTIYWRELV